MTLWQRFAASIRAMKLAWNALKHNPNRGAGVLVAITDNKASIAVGSDNVSPTMHSLLSSQLDELVERVLLEERDCDCPSCTMLRDMVKKRKNSDQSMAEA